MNQILSGNNGYCIKNGRKFYVDGFKVEDNPILITEFGGIAFSSSNENWGYGNKVKNKEEFLERFKSQLEYIKERSEIRGWCYTLRLSIKVWNFAIRSTYFKILFKELLPCFFTNNIMVLDKY